METRKDVIKKVLVAFLGEDTADETFDTVLDADEIDLLATAVDDALGR